MNNKVAIAISTRNRRSSFYRCIESLAEFTTGNFELFVVDDNSEVSYGNPDYSFTERAGISKVKNKCLQLCYESGAEHIFLLDDDTEVLKVNWYLPYIESGEHHLCATFHNPRRTVKNNIGIDLNLHYLANGYCLYFTRNCIQTVGGFDTRFNNKYEHNDLSRRIHAAGLTKYKYQDVYNSSELIYCLDQDKAIERSFTEKEIQENLKSGYDLYRWKEKNNTSEFIEFRT